MQLHQIQRTTREYSFQKWHRNETNHRSKIPGLSDHKYAESGARNSAQNLQYDASSQKARHFLEQTRCNKKWKLLVYNSVIVSRVLYGLESLEPTENIGRMLDVFQLKGLRKILNLHTTFVNRTNTNEFVYQQANDALEAPSVGPLRKIKPLTKILEDKRLKLLGHVLRRPRSHPQHQVTFDSFLARPKVPTLRRVGRPRKFWTTENMRKAWEIIQQADNAQPHVPFDPANRTIRETLIAAARNYQAPFD